MLKNLFNKVKCVCADHPDTELICDSENGRNFVFYKCPVCSSQISMLEYEAMIDKIDKTMLENNSVAFGSITNLTGMSWSNTKGVTYRIINHDMISDNFVVSVKTSLSRKNTIS